MDTTCAIFRWSAARPSSKDLIQEHGEDGLRYSSHIRADGSEMFRHACKMGAEGIVSKLATST